MMSKEDWDAIVKIIQHLEDGMELVKQGLYPVVHVQKAIDVAKDQQRKLEREENDKTSQVQNT